MDQLLGNPPTCIVRQRDSSSGCTGEYRIVAGYDAGIHCVARAVICEGHATWAGALLSLPGWEKARYVVVEPIYELTER